ncbi:Type I secretion target repeat protein [Candidatus Rhodobacter oscarellae]|uniref:Type I secretion target repeat protein n=1 Tax=Candidatus Rhodobacter oscarellae TaxID=1675527 RepID=A0A0J9ECJ2_9RHOB|nr:Hint domain-containing protein [Candidatus Rhodobacter lobularis]KMW60497.1 Type I secretion target repeat protein [Candidatus Rhodobacter lobularis]
MDASNNLDHANPIRPGASWFGPGTLISTTDGDLPVEWLAPGDKVITRDRGAQPLRWIGYRQAGVAPIDDWPIELPTGTVGPQAPSAPLLLAPGHKVLMRGPLVEHLFGHGEVFAPAEALILPETRGAPWEEQFCFQLLFDHHEIVLANGLWCESTYFQDVFEAPGVGITHQSVARPGIQSWEAKLLRTQVLPALRRSRNAA